MARILNPLVLVGLLVMAAAGFMAGKWLMGLGFLAGAGVMALPLVTGGGLGSFADAQRAVEFVRNPAGSIIDEACDRLLGNDEDEPARKPKVEAEPTSTFDADAAFARYQARMGATTDTADALQSAVVGASPSQETVRPTFGRKGL